MKVLLVYNDGKIEEREVIGFCKQIQVNRERDEFIDVRNITGSDDLNERVGIHTFDIFSYNPVRGVATYLEQSPEPVFAEVKHIGVDEASGRDFTGFVKTCPNEFTTAIVYDPEAGSTPTPSLDELLAALNGGKPVNWRILPAPPVDENEDDEEAYESDT